MNIKLHFRVLLYSILLFVSHTTFCQSANANKERLIGRSTWDIADLGGVFNSISDSVIFEYPSPYVGQIKDTLSNIQTMYEKKNYNLFYGQAGWIVDKKDSMYRDSINYAIIKYNLFFDFILNKWRISSYEKNTFDLTWQNVLSIELVQYKNTNYEDTIYSINKNVYNYDNLGNKISDSVFWLAPITNGDLKFRYCTNYFFENKNVIKSIQVPGFNNSLARIVENTFSIKGKILRSMAYDLMVDSSLKLISDRTYNYNEYDEIIFDSSYYFSNTIYLQQVNKYNFIYSFDSNNRIHTKIIQIFDTVSLDYKNRAKQLYEYDKFENVSNYEFYYWDYMNSNFILHTKNESEYYNKDQLKSFVRYDINNGIVRFAKAKETYSYSTFGNISKIEISSNTSKEPAWNLNKIYNYYYQSYFDSTKTIDNSHDIKTYVFPNPSNYFFTVVFETNEPELTTLNLVDINGKIIKQIETRLIQGINNVYLDLSNNSEGIYFLKINIGKKCKGVRLIKT